MIYPPLQGTGTSPDWFFVNTESCGGRAESLSLFLGFPGYIGFFSVGIKSRGHPRGPQARGRALGGAPPRIVHASGLLSGIFLLQYFLYFPKIFSVNFQPIPRTFISAQKNNTMVVLLKTASVRVSSNKIIPKSYKITVNMA